MNVKKMAFEDAQRWVPAQRLENEIANKVERLSGYGEYFDQRFQKLWQKQFDKHLKDMNKLRDRLDKHESVGGNGRAGKLLFAAGVLIVWAAAHETGYDTVVIERVKAWWRQGTLPQPYLNDNTIMSETVAEDGEDETDKD